MFRKDPIHYCDFDALNCTAVELEYIGEKMSFVVVLPNERHGLPELQSALTHEHLFAIFENLRIPDNDVILYLPKFRTETNLELSKHYQRLGVTDLFDSRKANLTGMDAKGALFVSAIAHKAVIEVNEEGTEAAAATCGTVQAASGSREYVYFDANHPFLFFIKMNATHEAVFAGNYSGPEDT